MNSPNSSPERGRRRVLRAAGAALAAVPLVPFAPALASSAAKPAAIRFGSPGAAAFARSRLKPGGVIVGVAHTKGWLHEAFEAEGIRLEFPTFKGGAPMVGQALANSQVDFAVQGDLMSVIGRSAGLPTRLILPSVKLGNAYVAVPAGSAIRTLQELRGKRVAYFKGNYIHLQVIRILATVGLTERDIRSISLDGPSAVTALSTGDVDAVFGASDLLALRDRGIARIVYSTVGQAPSLTAQSGFLVREAFAQQYPEITQRIVQIVVRAAHWLSEPAHREDVLDLWTSDRGLRSHIVEDYGGRPFEDRVSPLLDAFYLGRYEATQAEARTLGLLRGANFDVASWVDRRYLERALAELNLGSRWQPLDVAGRRVDRG